MMRSGSAEGEISDQARVYEYIVQRLESGNYLRLMVQARRAQTALCVFRWSWNNRLRAIP